MSAELHTLGLAEGLARLNEGTLTSRAWVDALLARAEAHADLGCYLHLDADGARAAADAADARRASGDKAPLLGVPLAHKDTGYFNRPTLSGQFANKL